MRSKQAFTIIIAIAFCGVLVSFAFSGYEPVPFAVEISTPRISFLIDGPPGVYPADIPVTVSVLSGFAQWTLYCQATPLVETAGKGMITPDRLYIAGGVETMFEIEEGMIPLSENPVIAMGTFTGPEPKVTHPLTFRIRTQWEDQPGTYVGNIIFTFLAMP